MLQLIFLCNYTLASFRENPSRKLHFSKGCFRLKIVHCDPFIKILIVLKFQKVLLILIYLENRTHLCRNYRLDFSTQINWKGIKLYRTLPLINALLWSLVKNSDNPKILKFADNIDSTRCSFFFSVITGFNPFIKVSTESFSYFHKVVQLGNYQFCSVHRNPICPKLLRNINFDLPWCSNSNFSVTQLDFFH